MNSTTRPVSRQRPSTETEYIEWARDQLGADFGHAETAALYNLNVAATINAIQDHQFWRQLPELLHQAAAQYRVDHEADLFPGTPELILLKKPYESLVDKTFRKNVIWNRDWPRPPHPDWFTDLNLYSLVDDVVRTKIVCTYLDGPGLVAQTLQNAAQEMVLAADIRKLSRDDGYYAHHLYVTFPTTVYTRNGVERVDLRVEFQVTTQPQELLRHLTHVYYRERRSKRREERDDWQWQFRTNRFKASYLSHALHLLEAMILDVRDTPDSEDGPENE